ncbi:LppA family lipoprotein [Rhodococcus sp. AW25M09]|uniref:LppA family lipoprotein n=1 Tax=Rhodococcus sp. AW25M09 TaxID=1268303 RepID=UPI00034994DA|nr:LppA family lipoprotein [Rhodococcus sp. AW25M09]
MAAAALAIVGVVAGCGADVEEPTVNDQDVAAIKDALYAKGTAEEEAARLEPLVIEMADGVVGVVPGLSWRWNREPLRIPCEAVPGDPGSASALALRNVVFDGPIPDGAWPQALSVVKDVSARVGATQLRVRVDEPGHHDVQLIGADKVQFGFGSREAAALFAQTGCHLNLSDQDEYTN